MNIILLDKDEINGDHTTLKDHRAEHIVKVLRSSRGDRVTVGIINGKTGYGIIKEIVGRKPYLVKLQLALERYPDIAPPIDILLALPRPIVFKRIISHLTTLGVRRILVVNAAKVEKSYWESSVVSENGWQRHVLEGLEQAVDTRLVDISFYRGFKPFMQEIVPVIKDRYQQMLVAHPHTTNSLAEVYRAGASPVLLAIGPEGGWNEYELDQMGLRGFDQFTLGARVLRVETAVNALHGAISMLRSLPENL
jgi:RsmE family RNA methyltransferase